jgi:hypothetical protein
MGVKLTKMTVALLLGILLAVAPTVATLAAPSAPAVKSCCCHGNHCCHMACCAAPKGPAAPVAPAPVPSTSQTDLQALSASIISTLTLPPVVQKSFSPQYSSTLSMTAIPLFQRDCSYLI